jgi:cytidylate kinase
MIIAIDGFAASGKGTLAALLAKHYNCECLFSGNLYRICAKKLIQDGIDIDQFILSPSKEIITMILKDAETLLNDDLGGDELSEGGSKIAKLDVVRQAIIEFERNWIKKRKNGVVEGRDTGTVVWPQADVKLFLVADPEVRARRRTEQLQSKGDTALDAIYSNLMARDKRDTTRSLHPLEMATDAILLDTTHLTIEETKQRAIDLIESSIKRV